jgi:hypothetical protein
MSKYFNWYLPLDFILVPWFVTLGTMNYLRMLALEEHTTFVASLNTVI